MALSYMLSSAMISLVQRDTKIIVAVTALALAGLIGECIDWREHERSQDQESKVPVIIGITDQFGALLAGIKDVNSANTRIIGYPLHPFDERPKFILRWDYLSRSPRELRGYPAWKPNDQLIEEKIFYFDTAHRGKTGVTVADYARLMGIAS